ncbi:uncharacterized protein LOC110467137 [Mizuhopecten yessoensis]|uniref:uncharacterized protein LOC110467137 n=1 Tax=Mizuhopecten yessoensis TaxID=6573 RepID=UPI000B45AD5F|nr:uncharacterized protein LOC110467137 [Mizuhopecten yessoensis]
MKTETSILKPRSEVNERICTNHPERIVMMECTTCEGVPVCLTCISTSHKGHMFLEIDGVADGASWTMIFKNARGKLAAISRRIDQLKELKEQNEKLSVLAISDIHRQGELMKREVDETCAHLVLQCKSIRTTNQTLLQESEDKLQETMSDIKAIITKSQTAFSSGMKTGSKQLRGRLKLEIDRPFDRLPDLQAQSFSPSQRSSESMSAEHFIGSIQSKVWVLEDSSVVDSTNHFLGNMIPILRATELYNVKVMATFRFSVDREIESVFPGFDGRSWMVCASSTEARLVDHAGEFDPRRSITLDKYIYINDLITTADKTKTLVCCSDQSIRQVHHSNGHCDVMFRTRHYATSLCESRDAGCILVSHYHDGMLVKYNQSGRALRTIDHDCEGKRLFHSPTSVRVNTTNGDVAVIESSCPRHVVVIDRNLQVLCRFGGYEFPTSYAEKKTGGSFVPSDICFDKHDNIVIADSGNKALILTDRHGSSTRILTTCALEPRRVGVEPTGQVWTGYQDGTVKIFRYKIPKRSAKEDS